MIELTPQCTQEILCHSHILQLSFYICIKIVLTSFTIQWVESHTLAIGELIFTHENTTDSPQCAIVTTTPFLALLKSNARKKKPTTFTFHEDSFAINEDPIPHASASFYKLDTNIFCTKSNHYFQCSIDNPFLHSLLHTACTCAGQTHDGKLHIHITSENQTTTLVMESSGHSGTTCKQSVFFPKSSSTHLQIIHPIAKDLHITLPIAIVNTLRNQLQHSKTSLLTLSTLGLLLQTNSHGQSNTVVSAITNEMLFDFCF